MSIIGKGSNGDFFGKINNKVCFIANSKKEKLKFNAIVDVKIIKELPNYLFCEMV